jgi:hypothetical protein
MDRVERYRQVVTRVIDGYTAWRPSHGEIASEAIVDPEKDHHEVVHVGWDRERRIHGSVIHLDVIDGEVWIQHDGTNRPVADELLAAGVPREDIVLGFHPARVRRLTGFAVN